MRFTSKTEYGLVCLIQIARNSGEDPEHWTTLKDISRAEKFPEPYVSKILRTLTKANIIESHLGKQGGYSLAREAREINLREVVEALEGATFEVFCNPKIRHEKIVCNHFSLCGVSPVWNRTKELLDDFYESVNVEMLMKGTMPPQVKIAAAG